jgi:hypothetical protein
MTTSTVITIAVITVTILWLIISTNQSRAAQAEYDELRAKYDALKLQYHSLAAKYEALLKEKEKSSN